MGIEEKAERHNALMQKFIRVTLREMIDGTASYAEMMVMLESIIYGCMLVTVRVYEQSPQVATGLALAAFQGAEARLVTEMNKPPPSE